MQTNKVLFNSHLFLESQLLVIHCVFITFPTEKHFKSLKSICPNKWRTFIDIISQLALAVNRELFLIQQILYTLCYCALLKQGEDVSLF